MRMKQSPVRWLGAEFSSAERIKLLLRAAAHIDNKVDCRSISTPRPTRSPPVDALSFKIAGLVIAAPGFRRYRSYNGQETYPVPRKQVWRHPFNLRPPPR